MLRIALACAALMVAVSPLGAQQAPPVDQPGPAQTQPEVELPPPFIPPAPPPPRRHYRAATHHHAATHHRRSAQRHPTPRRHVAARRHAAHAHHRAMHLSKRTIRQCHSLSYRQIMRHKYCRALMRQELEAAEHRHRHASHRHRSTHHHSSTHHRRSTHHHRR